MRTAVAVLLALHLTFAASRSITFPPHNSTCTGGNANGELLHPHFITCKTHKKAVHCTAGKFYDAFLHIHVKSLDCSQGCALEYHLDFTPLSVFIIGFLTTVLAGMFLALAMYLAVIKLAGQYGYTDDGERERIHELSRPGYGSFGGRLYCLGHFTDSVKSLLEFDIDDLEAPPTPPTKEKVAQDRVDWVAERIYLG